MEKSYIFSMFINPLCRSRVPSGILFVLPKGFPLIFFYSVSLLVMIISASAYLKCLYFYFILERK